MDPITIVAAVNAALALAENLIPKIQEMFRRGQITSAQQAEMLRRYNALKAQGEKQFRGPEWEA